MIPWADARRGRRKAPRNVLIAVLGLAAGLGATASPFAAAAAEPPPPRIAFRIPSQPLDEALLAFARQSGLPLAAVGELGGQRRSGAVSGVMTAEAALRRLLAGSGYGFVVQPDGVVTVSALPASPAVAPRAAAPRRRIAPAADALDLAAVVVTARRRDERWIDVPMAVSTTYGEQIDAMGLANAVDVLELMPGVSAVDTGGSLTQVQIRGVSSSLGGNDNGYYLDEVPFNGVTVPWHPDTRAFDLEKVEVLKGPQGTLFGEGSMGGTVRVLTRAPELDRVAAAAELGLSAMEGGGHGTSVKAMGNLPLVHDRMALRVVATQEEVPGWIDTPDGGRDVNAQRIETRRVRLRWSGSDRWITDFGFLRTGTEAPGGSNGADDLGRSRAILPVEARWRGAYLASHLDLRASRLTLLHSDARLDYAQDGQVTPTASLRGTIDFEIGNTELRWTSTGGGRFDWLLGYAHREARRRDDVRLDDWDLIAAQANRADTLFGEASLLGPRRRWSLTAGLRYFAEDVTASSYQSDVDTRLHATFRRFVPRLGVARHLSARRMLYASRSVGFRSGQLQPAASLVAAGAAGIQVPVTLAPDTVVSYELGLKQGSADGRLLFQAAVFHSDWRDLPVRVPIDDLLNALANSRGARLRGADLELTYRPLAGLRFTVGGALVDARYVEDVPDTALRRGTPVYNVPRLSLSGSVAYAWPVWRSLTATVAGSARHHSRRETGLVAGTAGDPVTVLDLRLGLESPHGWGWYLRGDNLGDERDAVDGRGTWEQATRLPRRSLGLEFHYRY